MPSIVERLTLYASQTGLVASLRAQPLKADGTTTGSLISTGFVSLGGANYLFSHSVPSDTECVRYELSTDPGVAVAVGDTIASLTGGGSGGGGSAGTLLIHTPLRLVLAQGEDCEDCQSEKLTLTRGSILDIRVNLVDAEGTAVPTTGTTLTGKLTTMRGVLIVALAGGSVVETLGSEGQLTVSPLDTSIAELAGINQFKLVVTRDNGAADVQSGEIIVGLE